MSHQEPNSDQSVSGDCKSDYNQKIIINNCTIMSVVVKAGHIFYMIRCSLQTYMVYILLPL